MGYRRYCVSLRDREDNELDTVEVFAPADRKEVIACIREAIAKDGRYYLSEETCIEQAESGQSVDYYATVSELRPFEGACPACGDESPDTMENARVAYSLGRVGQCARCGTRFVISGAD